MKFSLATLLVTLPLLAAQASALAVPEGILVSRQSGRGGKGGKGKGKGGAAAAGAAGAVAAAGAGNSTGAASNATTAAGAANTTATTVAAATNPPAGGGGDPQTSLTLDPSVISKAFALDGNQTPAAGQTASLTSTNNFINFCATTKQPLTNGQQVKTGSCNPAPMGQIPATTAMPSSKFQNPTNLQDIAPNTAFTISMAIQGMQTGNFVNAQTNYFSAPQQLNAQGQIIGHSHVVIEALSSITQTTPTDPTKFAFFLGLNAAAQGGVLTADVAKGLPAGAYKLSSINTAANHQPVVGPVAQHGSFDDAIYFTVGGVGGAAAGAAAGGAAAGNVASSSVAAPAAAQSTPAVKGGKGAKGAAAGNGASSSASSSAAAQPTGAAGGKGGKNGAKGGGRRFIRESY